MPHDHCFVGSTKKVISSHLRAAAAGGEDDQGRPGKGGQHGKKRGEKEEETSRVKKHENIPRKIDRELLACCFVGQPARRKLARTDGRMALTGARRFDQRWNHRPSAPIHRHHDALPFRGGHPGHRRLSDFFLPGFTTAGSPGKHNF